MSKKLILGIALSLVLFGGSFAGAYADCCGCLPHFNFSAFSGCGCSSNTTSHDADYSAYRQGNDLVGMNPAGPPEPEPPF